MPACVLSVSDSRVRLRCLLGADGSDYVNASAVAASSFPGFPAQPYIAAQAPLPHTVADFWHMLWEQDVQLIVMLTREKERGKVRPPAAPLPRSSLSLSSHCRL